MAASLTVTSLNDGRSTRIGVVYDPLVAAGVRVRVEILVESGIVPEEVVFDVNDDPQGEPSATVVEGGGTVSPATPEAGELAAFVHVAA